jgi:hypothetical protein
MGTVVITPTSGPQSTGCDFCDCRGSDCFFVITQFVGCAISTDGYSRPTFDYDPLYALRFEEHSGIVYYIPVSSSYCASSQGVSYYTSVINNTIPTGTTGLNDCNVTKYRALGFFYQSDNIENLCPNGPGECSWTLTEFPHTVTSYTREADITEEDFFDSIECHCCTARLAVYWYCGMTVTPSDCAYQTLTQAECDSLRQNISFDRAEPSFPFVPFSYNEVPEAATPFSYSDICDLNFLVALSWVWGINGGYCTTGDLSGAIALGGWTATYIPIPVDLEELGCPTCFTGCVYTHRHRPYNAPQFQQTVNVSFTLLPPDDPTWPQCPGGCSGGSPCNCAEMTPPNGTNQLDLKDLDGCGTFVNVLEAGENRCLPCCQDISGCRLLTDAEITITYDEWGIPISWTCTGSFWFFRCDGLGGCDASWKGPSLADCDNLNPAGTYTWDVDGISIGSCTCITGVTVGGIS